MSLPVLSIYGQTIDRRMDEKKKKIYTEICVDDLASCLAEDDWKIQTRQVHTDDLWETNAVLGTDGKSVEIVKEVRGKWSTLFFALKEGYLSLIHQFTKHDNTTTETEAGNIS